MNNNELKGRGGRFYFYHVPSTICLRLMFLDVIQVLDGNTLFNPIIFQALRVGVLYTRPEINLFKT